MKSNNFFPIERNRYFHGKMLTARDFELEQKYYNNKRRLLNRCVFGAGVVCGLGVYHNDDDSLMVETGLALDYTGREIVMPTPMICKLLMIDGAEMLAGNEQAFLCIKYDEHYREPVNNIGVPDSDSEEYNKIEEGFRLYLDVQQPNMQTLYGENGKNNVNLVFSHKDVQIYQVVPSFAVAGETFDIHFIIIKRALLPPVSFIYTQKSEHFKSTGNDDIRVEFQEKPESNGGIIVTESTIHAAMIADMQVPFASEDAQIYVNMGDVSITTELQMHNEIYLCANADKYAQMLHIRMSNLENQLSGAETPIYLAKIDYASAGDTYILRNVTALPFAQRINLSNYVSTNGTKQATSQAWDTMLSDVSANMETLKYWQKPEVSVETSSKSLSFHFGLPATEAYDYATSSGIVDVPLSGSIRVNAHFVSEEIPHNLGLGDVSISLAVEYVEDHTRRLLFGNGDIFAGKTSSPMLPKVDTAAILYPEKGTFQVGVLCLDQVEGNTLRVRWFAYKATRDTADMRVKDVVTIQIRPEIYKMKVMERIQFKAIITGSEDKQVSWSVQDGDGGKIDHNGLYQAPVKPGTYEIMAVSNADPDVKTSAFVIVEE